MRELFDDVFGNEPLDPMESARRNMRPNLRKRFYERAAVGKGAPYPVQVNTLVTSNRGILSQQRTLTYGDWRVGFAKDPPVATSENNCSWQTHCDVKIEPLTCAANGQASDCSLLFDTLAERCDLLIAERHEKIRIACPVDIILAAQNQSAATRLSADAQTVRHR